MNSADVMANIRDLAILLHRGNVTKGEAIIQDVAGYLKTVIQSDGNGDVVEL